MVAGMPAILFSWGMNNETNEHPRPRVWVMTEDAELRESLADMCRLALLRPIAVVADGAITLRRGVKRKDILVMEHGVQVPELFASLRRITVTGAQDSDAHGHVDIVIPGDEVALLHLLSRAADEDDVGEKAEEDVIVLVGAWHGGGGATTASYRLARASRSVLLDAAGNWGGDLALEDEVLVWDDIDPRDLPPSPRLIANLPRIAGVPTLTMSLGIPLRPDDDRVFAVAHSLNRGVVVDCGVHLDALFELAERLETTEKRVLTVLTGTGNERGAAALGRWKASTSEVQEPLYLLNGRPHPIFHAVADRFDLKWRRSPRLGSTRGWRRTQEKLWVA